MRKEIDNNNIRELLLDAYKKGIATKDKDETIVKDFVADLALKLKPYVKKSDG